MSLRDIKRASRGSVHREAAVPALYYATSEATPLDCTVRTWLKSDALTGSDAVMPGSAEMANPEDRLRFDLNEFPGPLRRNAIVSVEPGEAYRIDYLYPVDLGYQTARVTRLTAEEAESYAVPT